MDKALTQTQRAQLAAALSARFEVALPPPRRPPPLEAVTLAPPRIQPPGTLAGLCSTQDFDRAAHCYGKSFRDVVRALEGRLEHPPDVVAYPANEADLVAVLDWCTSAGAAAIPYGGGSSVVGGVECDVGEGYRAAVTIDMGRFNQVLEVDQRSSAARIGAGIFGPALEDQLRDHGLTLRHFPQSFEFSTLGGWLATRSGGHFATGPTHIDEQVESIRAVTPSGSWESRRLPGSGAGPSPDRLLLGSEGILGVIVEAWMRVVRRPRFRAAASVHFASLPAAVTATREVLQAGLRPANCRLLDRQEAALSAGADGRSDVLLLGFESADHPVISEAERALVLCGAHGGTLEGELVVKGPEATRTQGAPDAASHWRSSFLRAPYVRDALATASVIVETFETACTWEAFGALHAGVSEAVGAATRAICGGGFLTCRFTHVYPDGVAPYFSVFAPGRPGSEVAQWDEIKAAASEAVMAHGGTITHHHAVGRVHRPWYDRQRPEPFAQALAAAKAQLDPAWVLNPGVLIDPPPPEPISGPGG